MQKKIMIVGYGSTGKYVLDMATKMPAFSDCAFTVLSRTDRGEAEKRLNVTRVSAGLFDRFPEIDYVQADINDVERLAELLARERPDVIAYTGRYLKGEKYGEYSYPNGIGYGVWLPMAVVLVEKLMRAVKNSGIAARVINTSYGDGVSPALAALGLAPYTSAGNLNHLVPRMRRAIARQLGGAPEDVRVWFTGSHYANTYISKEGTPRGSPYHLRWTHRGKRVEGIDDQTVLRNSRDVLLSGPERNWMIASDVVRLMEMMLDASDREHAIHAPGPLGHIGGYPLRFCRGELSIDETALPLAQMRRINEGSLRFDGVDFIDERGIGFTQDVRDRMREVFGIDYPRFIRVSDCEAFSKEIVRGLRAYARRRNAVLDGN